MTAGQDLDQQAKDYLLAMEQFVKTKDMPGFERLRDVRFKIVTALLDDPKVVYAANPNTLLIVVACSLKSGVRTLPRSKAEDALFCRAVADLAPWRPDQYPTQGIAALLLCSHAYELNLVPAIESLAPAIRQIWSHFLFETPLAFVHTGDADKFAFFLRRLCEVVEKYLTHTPDPDADLINGFNRSTAFMQNYFNEFNLRDAMRARGRIIERLLERGGADLDQIRALRPAAARPRVGFISWHVTEGTETVFLAAHLERFDRSRYDVRLYTMHEPNGKIGASCRAWVQDCLRLPEHTADAVSMIRRENLDLAVFCTNVTAVANPITHIAAHRVARTQISTIASPVTTGLRNIDVMISGEANETSDSQAHYTEQLVCLRGALNCYPFHHMTADLPEPTDISRSSLGIPEDCTLFFSSANFFKILPELSKVWVEILREVPNSYLLLMPFNPSWSDNYAVDSFVLRLNDQLTQAGLEHDRIRLLASVPTIRHLHKVIALADVFLDSFPFSGACSMYDPLSVGIPTVARMGSVCRSRHSKAILEEAGLADWVTNDDASYIRAAVDLGTDPEKRSAAREQLARKREAGLPLSDTAAYAAKLMPVFDRILSEWNQKVAALHNMDDPSLKRRMEETSRHVGRRMPSFTDQDLVTAIVLPYLRSGGSRRLIDIGACLGAMTRPFLQEGWQAVMFEPDERCHSQLAALIQMHAGLAQLEKAAVTASHEGTIAFHMASLPGLSGLSTSPFAGDVATAEVPAVALNKYIAGKCWHDVDFIKIDAEGHDLDILRSIDFGKIRPRLVMVEFGDQFTGQDRKAIEATLHEMRDRDYRACIVCLRALGKLEQHEWATNLLAIGVDEVPSTAPDERLFGNILFFSVTDRDFLPSMQDWLEHLQKWH